MSLELRIINLLGVELDRYMRGGTYIGEKACSMVNTQISRHKCYESTL